MFTFQGKARPYCDGVQRRDFLKIGAFGAGLSLADILRAEAAPNTPKPTRPKAAIMIYLSGGPSHIDMYDLKPDAPAEFRGEFNPIATNVPGVQISEHFPMQARMWDKLAVVRSLTSVDEHSDSLVMTGYSEQTNRTQSHPSFGAVVSKLANGPQDIPPYVSLRGMSVGTEPGYLGIAHRPFTPDGPGIENLRARTGVKMDDRKQLLAAFDELNRDIDTGTTMRGMDTFTTRAFDMISSGGVRKAMDLSNEDPRTMDRYRGDGVEVFLRARRLVEAGVRCVTLSFGGWDTHDGNFKILKRQLPNLDRGIANLIQDLHDRGMEDDVVTVVWGEFGRTPKINSTNAGRDHWSPAMSAMVAGGGLKMGQAVGSTTARGETPKDRPYKVSNLLATMYQAMGIDPATTFNNAAGRPMYLLDDREPVQELI